MPKPGAIYLKHIDGCDQCKTGVWCKEGRELMLAAIRRDDEQSAEDRRLRRQQSA